MLVSNYSWTVLTAKYKSTLNITTHDLIPIKCLDTTHTINSQQLKNQTVYD